MWTVEQCQKVISESLTAVMRPKRDSQHDATLWNTIRNTRALLERLLVDKLELEERS